MAASVDCEISGVTASPVPRRWVASASSSNRNTTRSVSERVASEAITDPAHRIVPASLQSPVLHLREAFMNGARSRRSSRISVAGTSAMFAALRSCSAEK